MNRTILNLSILTAGLLFGLSAGCSFTKVWISDEEVHSYEATGLHTLNVRSDNGRVHVMATEGIKRIEVRALKRAGGVDDGDAGDCLAAFRILSRVEGGTRKLFWEWRNDEPDAGWTAGVDFLIRIPMDLNLDVETNNGEVEVKGMKARAGLVTHNGRIRVKEHSGFLAAEANNGGIEAKVRTDEVRLLSNDGSIDVEFQAVPTLKGSVRANNGSIVLKIKGDPATRFVCESHNGTVRMTKDLEATHTEMHRFEGIMGTGMRGTLEVETSNGSILIE